MACVCLLRRISYKNRKFIHCRFLLARLYVGSLQDKHTKSAIRLALDTLSKGSQTLEKTYEDAIKRLKSQLPGSVAVTTRVLTWILYAQGPLTTSELSHALAVKLGEASLDLENLYGIEDIVSVCAGLVVINESSNVVRFVHYTTREYFEYIRESWNPQGPLDIASTCLTYLAYDDFRYGRSRSSEYFYRYSHKYSFLNYAASHWANHVMSVLSSP